MVKSKIPANLTFDLLCRAVERRNRSLDNPGFCIACGFESDECEPDGRRLECESCGEQKVYAPEVLLGVI